MFDPLLLVLGPGGAAVIVVVIWLLLVSPLLIEVGGSCSHEIAGQVEVLSSRWRDQKQALSRRTLDLSAGLGSWLRHHSPCAALASFTKARLPRHWR